MSMNTRLSAHVLAFNSSGDILLVKRRDVPIWVIPGGTAEKDELPAQTAAREFFEETGIRVFEKKLSLAIHYFPLHKTGKHKYTFTTQLAADAKPIPTAESSVSAFFSPDQLPEPISVYEMRRIQGAIQAMRLGYYTLYDEIHYYSEFRKLIKNPFLMLLLAYKYWTAKKAFRAKH